MKRGSVYFFLICLAAGACTANEPVPEAAQVITLKEMSELATAEYVVTKIIKASDNKSWFKLGERKILMSCRATIKAGIDLSLIKEDNISVNKKSISLLLPHAKVLSLDIRPEDVKTEYETATAFRSSFSSAERDQLAAQGEAGIRREIQSSGILQTAEINATLVLTDFLRTLGYGTINIHFDDTPIRRQQ